MNFREFIDNQVVLDFPTITKSGEVIRVVLKGANYCIYVTGGITILIPRKIYHKKYNRLPREKTINHPGDMISAVFYKHKKNHKQYHGLKDFKLDELR